MPLTSFRRIVAFSFFLGAFTTTAQGTFEITIERQVENPDCTLGYMYLNDELLCYTLEKPGIGNISDISHIPVGTYDAIIRYDKTVNGSTSVSMDYWRIELLNVPDNRKYIQIHRGNFPADSKGCILVGNELNDADRCYVGDSAGAFSRLKTAFFGTPDPNSCPDQRIKVIIKSI